MEQANLAEILDAVERESFLDSTFIASGHATVARILAETPEIQTLLQNKTASLPLMRSRYKQHDATMTDNARLVYLIVFGLAGDREMIDTIIAYLKRSLNGPPSQLMSPWHPFLHGAQALERITEGQVQAPRSSGTKGQFEEFLRQVEEWEKTHPGSLDQQN
jgi:hypothetical protein